MDNIILVVPIYIHLPILYPIVTRFFESVEKHYPNLEIIALDDASPLYPLPSWSIVERNKENKGYVKTTNRLISLAIERGANTIIVANDDLTIKKGDLDWAFLVSGLEIVSPRDTASDPTESFGAIFALTKEVIEKVGYLDERFKHYFADKEYLKRSKERGVAIRKVEDTVIDHIESATFNLLDKQTLLENDALIYAQM